MYVLLVLCLVSAAVALPTPESLHTNSPNVPAPPELPSDIKEEHDAQVPVPKPLVDPISHEENDAKVSVQDPSVEPPPQVNNDAQVPVQKPLIDPISHEENDAEVSVPGPSEDPILQVNNDAQVPVPKPLVDPIPEGTHDAQVPASKPVYHINQFAIDPLPKPLVYPIPFDSQEDITQNETFAPEKSGEIFITLDSEEIKELLAIEKIFGSQEASEFEESLIESKAAKQSEEAKESGKEEKNDSKSEELQKNKDSKEANVPNKPDLVDDDFASGVLSWFQDLVPLLNNHYYQHQNRGNSLSAVKEDQPIYIIEVEPERTRH